MDISFWLLCAHDVPGPEREPLIAGEVSWNIIIFGTRLSILGHSTVVERILRSIIFYHASLRQDTPLRRVPEFN